MYFVRPLSAFLNLHFKFYPVVYIIAFVDLPLIGFLSFYRMNVFQVFQSKWLRQASTRGISTIYLSQNSCISSSSELVFYLTGRQLNDETDVLCTQDIRIEELVLLTKDRAEKGFSHSCEHSLLSFGLHSEILDFFEKEEKDVDESNENNQSFFLDITYILSVLVFFFQLGYWYYMLEKICSNTRSQCLVFQNPCSIELYISFFSSRAIRIICYKNKCLYVQIGLPSLVCQNPCSIEMYSPTAGARAALCHIKSVSRGGSWTPNSLTPYFNFIKRNSRQILNNFDSRHIIFRDINALTAHAAGRV